MTFFYARSHPELSGPLEVGIEAAALVLALGSLLRRPHRRAAHTAQASDVGQGNTTT
ncbi:hypothetical protein ACIRD3_31880 [Kitasatospora sp. NPDC093550]|uniref:hypothetical protein n=1 Tax=Kitasatospora sp. NPDC093550 TaxID=3364089 RepID=UPI00381E28BC